MARSMMFLVAALVVTAWVHGAGEAPFPYTVQEKKLLELTNAERKKEKLPPLKLNPVLTKVARGHSQNMAKQSKLEHDLDNKTAFDRIRAAGYGYAKAAENIAFCEGKTNLAEIMEGWMDSKGHRENILFAEYNEIGLGVASNAKGETYFTQVFARPRPKDVEEDR